MTRHQICFSYIIHPGRASLTESDQILLSHAQDALSTAYAPYSRFKVGVAISTTDQHIVKGSNQENASFPIGQCAERVALYQLRYLHNSSIMDSVAIIIDNELHRQPASPCGACRQLLTEFRNQQDAPVRLLLASLNCEEIIEIEDVSVLLPMAFDGSFLGF